MGGGDGVRPPLLDSAEPRAARSDRQRPAARAGSERLFRTQDVVSLLGLSRRQLQYWSQTGLIEPSVKTQGGHHRYDFRDLVSLKATKRLIDAGVSVQRIRATIGSLRRLLPEVRQPLAELVLVATGDVIVIFHEGTAFEAVSGQEWIFEVADFEREVDAWVRETGAQPKRVRRNDSFASRAETTALR